MIERKKGHIVAVSSFCSKVSFGQNVAYTSAKFGTDGFMNALYDDLCLRKQDEFIKLSTVYSGFERLQKDSEDTDEPSSDIPDYEPAAIGEQIVKGILVNRREFFVPSTIGILTLVK